MKLSYKPYSLIFKHPFGVSGNTRKETPTVFVSVQEGGYLGYGEACLPPYLGETISETLAFFEKARLLLNAFNLSSGSQLLFNQLDSLLPGHNAAKAALNMAVNDLQAKLAGQSFAAWNGLPIKKQMPTSFTIGIDTEEKLIQKINEAEDYDILKIKAGTVNDKALISLIRKHSNKALYVDVNQGWTDKQYVLEMAGWLADQNVILLEQPMPKEMKAEMKWLSKRCPITTVADESVKRLSDLKNLEGSFTGINLKLMKCTGLDEALLMIDHCKQQGLKILLGCMAESSCGTSAMAQLMGLADYVDLDAPQLYTNDPFEGVKYKNGDIIWYDLPGIGAVPNKNLIL